MVNNITDEPCSNRILVMGIGNILLGDEGLGVHAIRELEMIDLPAHVALLDAGTAFIDAISHIENIHTLIIIDAINGGQKSGTVYRISNITPDSIVNHSDSIHSLSIIDMMKLAQFALPDTVCILGIEPEIIDWSMEISATVAEAMPRLIDAVRQEICAHDKAGCMKMYKTTAVTKTEFTTNAKRRV